MKIKTQDRAPRRSRRGQAFFVKFPRCIEDLFRVHLTEGRKPFVVMRTIALGKVDYENFLTDMTVERVFLELASPLRQAQLDGSLPCVLVKRRGERDGVLVVPDEQGYVIWAAYVSAPSASSQQAVFGRRFVAD